MTCPSVSYSAEVGNQIFFNILMMEKFLCFSSIWFNLEQKILHFMSFCISCSLSFTWVSASSATVEVLGITLKQHLWITFLVSGSTSWPSYGRFSWYLFISSFGVSLEYWAFFTVSFFINDIILLFWWGDIIIVFLMYCLLIYYSLSPSFLRFSFYNSKSLCIPYSA